MVKLEEVPDEEFEAQQQGPKEDEDEWDTDSGTHTHRTAVDAHPADRLG